ncbi:MAG: YabP/YqfC family sporulation protein [Clostridia bacterium]|nr:YabP/YqfC family sporulation protein [Clostridia bacterium]
MSYGKEISEKIKSNLDGATNCYSVTLGKGYVVIEGHKGVLSFESGRISVRLKKGKIDIEGDGMNIASSQKEELVIKGKITNLSLDGVE